MTFQVIIQIYCGTDILLVIVWHGFSHHASVVPFVQCNGKTDLPGPLNRLIYCLTQAWLVTSSCYWVKPTRHTSWYDKIIDLNYVAVKRLQVVPVNLSCQPPWQWWSLLGPCCGWKLCWLTLVTQTCVTWWVLPTAMFEPPPNGIGAVTALQWESIQFLFWTNCGLPGHEF